MKSYECKQCKLIFESKKGCKSRTPLFCSKKCYSESMKLHIKCKLCGTEIENKHSVSISKRVYCSKECQGKARKNIPLNLEWKKALSEGRKNSEKCKGENLYNFKGGKETSGIRAKTSFYKRKNKLKLSMPIDHLKKILILQENKCFFCERELKEYKAIEHLTPVSKGGDNQNYNLVYACQSCNSTKRQNTLEEFAIKQNRLDWIEKWEKLFIETL